MIHPDTQAALDAAHAALDTVRHQLRLISETADQEATIAALEAITDSIADVPIPVATESDSAPAPKKAKKAKTAKRR